MLEPRKPKGPSKDEGTQEDEGTEAESSSGADDSSEGESDTGPPPDSDGDGLDDDEEAMYGTDPFDKDSDDDTYWDSWEIIEGTDPLDYESRIYTGFWPYNPHKGELEQGDWADAERLAGTPMVRAALLDQYNEWVDYYDLGGTDLFQIVDICAIWCGPCHNVASWHVGDINASNQWIEDTYPTVRDKIHDQKVMFITVLTQDNAGGETTLADLETWATDYPDALVPTLNDPEQQIDAHYNGSAYPTFFIVSPDMKIEYFPASGDSTSDDPYPALGLVENELD